MAQNSRKGLSFLILFALALIAQGCGEEDQNRPLSYKKGTYRGQVDEKLSPEQVEILRQRAARQKM